VTRRKLSLLWSSNLVTKRSEGRKNRRGTFPDSSNAKQPLGTVAPMVCLEPELGLAERNHFQSSAEKKSGGVDKTSSATNPMRIEIRSKGSTVREGDLQRRRGTSRPTLEPKNTPKRTGPATAIETEMTETYFRCQFGREGRGGRTHLCRTTGGSPRKSVVCFWSGRLERREKQARQ